MLIESRVAPLDETSKLSYNAIQTHCQISVKIRGANKLDTHRTRRSESCTADPTRLPVDCKYGVSLIHRFLLALMDYTHRYPVPYRSAERRGCS